MKLGAEGSDQARKSCCPRAFGPTAAPAAAAACLPGVAALNLTAVWRRHATAAILHVGGSSVASDDSPDTRPYCQPSVMCAVRCRALCRARLHFDCTHRDCTRYGVIAAQLGPSPHPPYCCMTCCTCCSVPSVVTGCTQHPQHHHAAPELPPTMQLKPTLQCSTTLPPSSSCRQPRIRSVSGMC